MIERLLNVNILIIILYCFKTPHKQQVKLCMMVDELVINSAPYNDNASSDANNMINYQEILDTALANNENEYNLVDNARSNANALQSRSNPELLIQSNARKRKRNEAEWTRNLIKNVRLTEKSYVCSIGEDIAA
jgi:hypothetical protein